MLRFGNETDKIFSFRTGVVNVNSSIIDFFFITFLAELGGLFWNFFLFLLGLFFDNFLVVEPLEHIGLFWNMLEVYLDSLQYKLINKPHIWTVAALKATLPVNNWNTVDEFFSVFLHFLLFELIAVFFLNPLRQFILVSHQLLLQLLFDINQHVGSSFGLNKFLLHFHLLGIKMKRLMESSEVVLQGLLSADLLDNLVIELIPQVAYFHKVVIMTGLSFGPLMNQNRIQIIIFFLSGNRPSRKIELFLILKGCKDLNIVFFLETVLKPFQLDHQNRRKICDLHTFNIKRDTFVCLL